MKTATHKKNKEKLKSFTTDSHHILRSPRFSTSNNCQNKLKNAPDWRRSWAHADMLLYPRRKTNTKSSLRGIQVLRSSITCTIWFTFVQRVRARRPLHELPTAVQNPCWQRGGADRWVDLRLRWRHSEVKQFVHHLQRRFSVRLSLWQNPGVRSLSLLLLSNLPHCLTATLFYFFFFKQNVFIYSWKVSWVVCTLLYSVVC